jgi:hypothetical protein
MMLTPAQRRVARALRRVKRVAGLVRVGPARPSSPVSVFAEDFSLLIRTPRRFRIARSRIRVLS